MRCVYLLCAAALLVTAVQLPAECGEYRWLHGEIVEVFPEQNKLQVLTCREFTILRLASGAEIYRRGRPVSLNSARPIAESRFQEGLFLVDRHEEVILMIVDYTIAEIQTETGTMIVYYDIFGRVKDVEQFPQFERDSVISSE